MTITHHPEVVQGSDEWHALRCGLLTASEMKLILTPKALKPAASEAHLYELLGQRITGYVEPRYVGDDMLRGMNDEIKARDLYAERYAPVETCGFITNDELGFPVGYSPDGLVVDDGLIECKSRAQKFQVERLVMRSIDPDHMLQVQTGLWVSGRRWCDYVSYCGGMPMAVIRVHPVPEIVEAIKEAAHSFEVKLQERWADYRATMASGLRMVPTERTVEQEMFT